MQYNQFDTYMTLQCKVNVLTSCEIVIFAFSTCIILADSLAENQMKEICFTLQAQRW